MTSKVKHILVLTLTGIVLLGLGLWFLLRPNDAVSDTERRPLQQMPSLSADGLLSGQFITEFSDAAADQFPLRESFRTAKALFQNYALLRGDNNGYYAAQGHLAKLDTALNEAAIDKNAAALQHLYDTQMSRKHCRIYAAVVPDKNAYLAPAAGYPHPDYEKLIAQFTAQLFFAKPIDLQSVLTIDDYYRTDPHWRQERLLPVAKTILSAMGQPCPEAFTEQSLPMDFYGTYAGQAALPMAPDTIRFLTSEELEQCTVTSYNTGKAQPSALYDFQKAEGKDPYDFFLGGADALLVIENPNAQTDRELVLFRDSFGSSLAPLLVPSYRKVTLVDLRYLQLRHLPEFLQFDGQDVLFLYSTSVLGSAVSMENPAG